MMTSVQRSRASNSRTSGDRSAASSMSSRIASETPRTCGEAGDESAAIRVAVSARAGQVRSTTFQRSL
jgi:hypothetical protein